MTIDQGLTMLAAMCLGLALRPHLNTFRRKAWTLALIGSGFGLLLATRNASQLAGSATAEQAKVFTFSLAVTAVMIVLSLLTMWFTDRGRST